MSTAARHSRDWQISGPRSDPFLPQLLTSPHNALPTPSEHHLRRRVEGGNLDGALRAILLRSALANLFDELSDLLVRVARIDDESGHLTALRSGRVGRGGKVDRGEGEGVRGEETVQALMSDLSQLQLGSRWIKETDREANSIDE